MKLSEPYRCDHCDRAKGDANHWWLRHLGNPKMFNLYGWDDEEARRPYVEHICSEACAVKALSKWMATLK